MSTLFWLPCEVKAGSHVPVNGASLSFFGIDCAASSLKHASVIFVASPPWPKTRKITSFCSNSLARTENTSPMPAV